MSINFMAIYDYALYAAIQFFVNRLKKWNKQLWEPEKRLQAFAQSSTINHSVCVLLLHLNSILIYI